MSKHERLLGNGDLLGAKPRFAGPPYYLVNDTFTTDRAAGAVNGTNAEPGPGRRVVTDTASYVTIAGGKLIFGLNAPFGNAFWLNPALVRAPGRLLLATYLAPTAISNFTYGFDTDTATAGIGDARLTFSAAGLRYSTLTLAAAPVAGIRYWLAIVLRDVGAFLFVQGGGFTQWTLLWILASGNSSPLYGSAIANGTLVSPVEIDDLRVPAALWLPSPLLSDGFSVWGTSDGAGHAEGVTGGLGSGGGGLWPYVEEGLWQASGGIASAAALTGGGVALAYMDVGTLDLIATVKVTRVGGVAGLVVRGDAVNHVRAVHNGTSAQLIKRVSGVDTILINAAATYVAGAEIRVIADGQKFRLFYNNLAIGSEQTIADAVLSTDGYAGIYTTDTGNTFDDFVVYVRGSGGEYSALDAF